MATVLIVVYLLIVIALIVVILLQRSEGGGLGMGGGGGLMTARGSANLLTRTTAILGTLFMVTAVALTIVSQLDNSSTSILDRAVGGDGAPATVLDALDTLSGGRPDLALPEEGAAGAAQDSVGDGADLALPQETPAGEAPAADAPAAEGGPDLA